MTDFANQSIGIHGENHEYVSVWYDETEVTGFVFHSAMINGHRVHGMTVEPRHVWAFMAATHSAPTEAMTADGYKIYVREIWVDANGMTRELRASNRFGKPLARMIKTGYVQPKIKGEG